MARTPDPTQVNFDGPAESTRKPVTMDQALRLAARIDRLMAEMSPWARQWALEFLAAKYPPPRQDSPCNAPPL